MRKLLLAHQILGLKGTGKIRRPECKAHTHPEVLRALTNLARRVLEKLGLLKRLEAELVKELVTLVINGSINLSTMFLHCLEDFTVDGTHRFTRLRCLLIC